MSRRRKKCSRCAGYIRAHTPFCSYLGRRRVVGLALHEKGMIYTYGDGERALVTNDHKVWVNLRYAKQLGYDLGI